MLIPHLHFDGNCMEAVEAYERAFHTEADRASADYTPDGRRVAHISMRIHGAEVFLNDGLVFIRDAYGGAGCPGHLCVTFTTPDELLACYEALKPDGAAYPFRETPYSKLVGNFTDKFGVLWGFMADA